MSDEYRGVIYGIVLVADVTVTVLVNEALCYIQNNFGKHPINVIRITVTTKATNSLLT